MGHYCITSRVSGLILGVYDAESAAGALDAMAREAGYADYARCREVTGGEDGELAVTAVEQG